MPSGNFAARPRERKRAVGFCQAPYDDKAHDFILGGLDYDLTLRSTYRVLQDNFDPSGGGQLFVDLASRVAQVYALLW